MFTEYNTEGYNQDELDEFNRELENRIAGIDDPDEIDDIEKALSDEIARR